jgi:putative ABC transport system permease protein
MINIPELAIGMAACFFVFLYVNFESSYDRFNKNADNLYRVNISFSGSFSNLPPMATNHPAVGPAMKADFPEVIDFARVVTASLFGAGFTFYYTDKKDNTVTFNEDKIFVADLSFLRMFSIPFVEEALTLHSLTQIPLSYHQRTATKFFGKENPAGRALSLNKQQPFKITGVFKDASAGKDLERTQKFWVGFINVPQQLSKYGISPCEPLTTKFRRVILVKGFMHKSCACMRRPQHVDTLFYFSIIVAR